MELFVYVSMLDEDESRGAPIIITLGATEEDRTAVRDTWNTFNAQACKCFLQADKDRIMNVVDGCPGGAELFSGHVRQLVADIFASQPAPALTHSLIDVLPGSVSSLS